jgi:hypothetical protein
VLAVWRTSIRKRGSAAIEDFDGLNVSKDLDLKMQKSEKSLPRMPRKSEANETVFSRS